MKELKSYTKKRRSNFANMEVIVNKRNKKAILSSLNEWRSQVAILQIEK